MLLSQCAPFVLIAVSFCSAAPLTISEQTPATAPVHSDRGSAAPIAHAERLEIVGVPNAGKISDALVRGAQPSKQGFDKLKKLGVTTIVNLRSGGSGITWERKVTESLGLHFVSIPVRGWMPPSDEQVAQFLSLFHDAANQRVFVHCRFGDDRTGVMVATYRIAQQHWTAEQAAEEMYFFGFHHHLYRAMESYVREFPGAFARKSVFASLGAAPGSEAKQP